MKKKSKTMQFFLGSSSPRGFYSKFNSLYDPEDGWYCRILKGSPGCGKSNLIKKIGDIGVKNNIDVEYIYCSADPDSLDAVIFPELKSCIVDGTAPHTLDPIYPGAVEHIINLGDCWDSKILKKSREKIIKSSQKNIALHNRAKKYLAAYGALSADMTEEIIDEIDFNKIKSYSQMMAKKIFIDKLEKSSVEFHRFISAISLDGILFYEKNLKNFENIYEIVDEHGIIGDLIIKYLRNSAISSGYDITVCYAPLSLNERFEALIIPELSLAVIVSGRWFTISEDIKTKKILSNMFYKNEEEPVYHLFNKEKETAFVLEASKNMKKAKKVHDELESYYIEAMDFDAVNKITEKIISEIF